MDAFGGCTPSGARVGEQFVLAVQSVAVGVGPGPLTLSIGPAEETRGHEETEHEEKHRGQPRFAKRRIRSSRRRPATA